jgi:hypothetical protein
VDAAPEGVHDNFLNFLLDFSVVFCGNKKIKGQPVWLTFDWLF